MCCRVPPLTNVRRLRLERAHAAKDLAHVCLHPRNRRWGLHTRVRAAKIQPRMHTARSGQTAHGTKHTRRRTSCANFKHSFGRANNYCTPHSAVPRTRYRRSSKIRHAVKKRASVMMGECVQQRGFKRRMAAAQAGGGGGGGEAAGADDAVRSAEVRSKHYDFMDDLSRGARARARARPPSCAAAIE